MLIPEIMYHQKKPSKVDLYATYDGMIRLINNFFKYSLFQRLFFNEIYLLIKKKKKFFNKLLPIKKKINHFFNQILARSYFSYRACLLDSSRIKERESFSFLLFLCLFELWNEMFVCPTTKETHSSNLRKLTPSHSVNWIPQIA